MPKWLRDGISAIGSALIALAILFVAVAFGVAVNNQVGGPFWVALLSAIAFVLFVVLPLHLALVAPSRPQALADFGLVLDGAYTWLRPLDSWRARKGPRS